MGESQAEITELELSELARAGRLIVQQPFTDIAFHVFHGKDAPGRLLRTIEEKLTPPDGHQGPFLQTLATAANGRSLIAGTSTATLDGMTDAEGAQRLSAGRWSGRSRTNPTFLYDSAGVIEGIVVLSDLVLPLTPESTRLMKAVVRTIARAASNRGLPIVTLQAPSHVPGGEQRWASTVGSAVRFAVAVRRLDVRQRLAFVKQIVEFCATEGLGLWLRDPTLTTRTGNWVQACAVKQDHRPGRAAVENLVDVTIVGPARVGSTSSILECLRYLGSVGVAACSVAAMNDLAFVHLQLTGEFSTIPPDEATYVDQFIKSLPEWLGLRPTWWRDAGSDAADALAEMEERAKYYRCMVGPVTSPPAESDDDPESKPVWVSWELTTNEQLTALLKGLRDAMQEVASNRPRELPAYNIEYLISRAMPDGRTRGRAKLSVPMAAIRRAVAGDWSLPTLGKEFCSLVENRWQTAMADARPTELTVAWREHWLGHWTSEL